MLLGLGRSYHLHAHSALCHLPAACASNSYNASVFLSENAKSGDSVGPAISAVDPDANDPLTFTMVSGNATLFRVAELAPKVAGIQVAAAGQPNVRFADLSFDLLHMVGGCKASVGLGPASAPYVVVSCDQLAWYIAHLPCSYSVFRWAFVWWTAEAFPPAA